MDKMEARSEICLFVGYPKETRGYSFYSPLDKKVFVRTNATFLENKYIEEHESKNKVLLEEMKGSGFYTSIPEIHVEPNTQDFIPLATMVVDYSGRCTQVLPSTPINSTTPKVLEEQAHITQLSSILEDVETVVEIRETGEAVGEQNVDLVNQTIQEAL